VSLVAMPAMPVVTAALLAVVMVVVVVATVASRVVVAHDRFPSPGDGSLSAWPRCSRATSRSSRT